MVLVLGDGIRVTDPEWVTWSNQLTSAVALGPVSSQSFATQTVSLALDELGVGTRSLYLGASRALHPVPGQLKAVPFAHGTSTSNAASASEQEETV